jgi:hypothetical protein
VAAPFSLGRWGIPVNVAGLVFAGATLLNLAWARDTTNPVWKLDIRVVYWLVGIPLVIGLVYYPLHQHRRLGRDEPALGGLDPLGVPAPQLVED